MKRIKNRSPKEEISALTIKGTVQKYIASIMDYRLQTKFKICTFKEFMLSYSLLRPFDSLSQDQKHLKNAILTDLDKFKDAASKLDIEVDPSRSLNQYFMLLYKHILYEEALKEIQEVKRQCGDSITRKFLVQYKETIERKTVVVQQNAFNYAIEDALEMVKNTPTNEFLLTQMIANSILSTGTALCVTDFINCCYKRSVVENLITFKLKDLFLDLPKKMIELSFPISDFNEIEDEYVVFNEAVFTRLLTFTQTHSELNIFSYDEFK